MWLVDFALWFSMHRITNECVRKKDIDIVSERDREEREIKSQFHMPMHVNMCNTGPEASNFLFHFLAGYFCCW